MQGPGKDGAASAAESTQSTQYDGIGAKYLEIKVLPAVQPEMPSILGVLGEGGVKGMKCLGTLFFVMWLCVLLCLVVGGGEGGGVRLFPQVEEREEVFMSREL